MSAPPASGRAGTPWDPVRGSSLPAVVGGGAVVGPAPGVVDDVAPGAVVEVVAGACTTTSADIPLPPAPPWNAQ